jgi:hypothetical protein
MHRVRIGSRTTFAAALAALMFAALAPAHAAAATRPTTADVEIGYECISGRSSDGARVQLVWKSADGTRKARASVRASSYDGRWQFCSEDGDIVQVGDRIRVGDGKTAHTLIVPELTLVINRVDDFFKGRAPANQYVRLICLYVNGFEPCQSTWRLRVNSEGKWSFRPRFEVMGWQQMSLRWKSEVGDVVSVRARGPYVDATIGSAIVRGAGKRSGPVTVVLRRSGSNDVVGTAVTTADSHLGEFKTKFRDATGNPVKVHVGDRITSSVSPDVDWTVRKVVASADAAADVVSGTCPMASFFAEALVLRNGYEDSDWTWPEEDGSFEIDFSGLGLQPGEPIRVRCYLLGAGDWVGRAIVSQ